MDFHWLKCLPQTTVQNSPGWLLLEEWGSTPCHKELESDESIITPNNEVGIECLCFSVQLFQTLSNSIFILCVANYCSLHLSDKETEKESLGFCPCSYRKVRNRTGLYITCLLVCSLCWIRTKYVQSTLFLKYQLWLGTMRINRIDMSEQVSLMVISLPTRLVVLNSW